MHDRKVMLVREGVAYGVRLSNGDFPIPELYPFDDEHGPAHGGVHGATVEIVELPIALQLDFGVNAGALAQYIINDEEEVPVLLVNGNEIPLCALAGENAILVFVGMNASLAD